jgi:hypothetical protein
MSDGRVSRAGRPGFAMVPGRATVVLTGSVGVVRARGEMAAERVWALTQANLRARGVTGEITESGARTTSCKSSACRVNGAITFTVPR